MGSGGGGGRTCLGEGFLQLSVGVLAPTDGCVGCVLYEEHCCHDFWPPSFILKRVIRRSEVG